MYSAGQKVLVVMKGGGWCSVLKSGPSLGLVGCSIELLFERVPKTVFKISEIISWLYPVCLISCCEARPGGREEKTGAK